MDVDEPPFLFGEIGLKGLPPPKGGACERCGATEGVQWEDSRTAYDTTPLDTPTRLERIADRDDPPPDPNRPVFLCRDCAAEHHEFWDSQWEEYYRSRW